METTVHFFVGRDTYSEREAASQSLTVEELISVLERMDPDARVIFNNDNGYTYGYIKASRIHEHEIEND